MALYEVGQGKVKVIRPQEFRDEAALQQLIDDNLEDITGVRLIESQYAIPNGRIDSLGIDEQNVPVVIEYKWGRDPGAIVQGLSYLQWVKENVKTFELLVKDKFGKVKVNWSSAPRLLIIAKDFDVRELSAINLLSPSVELKKYSYYGNLLSVEDVTPPKAARTLKGAKVLVGEEKERTVEDLVKRAPSELKEVFYNLRDRIMELGDDVREKVGAWYCDYRKSSTFATVNVQPKKNRLLVFIKMGDKKIEDPKVWTSPIPESFGYGKLNTKFEISELVQIDYAIDLIIQAYEYVP